MAATEEEDKEEEFVTVEGVKFRVRETIPSSGRDSSKPVIVLFHGFSFSIDEWSKIGTPEFLSSHGYSSLAIDLPRGKASRSDRVIKNKLSEFVPLLRNALQELGVKKSEKLVIIGPSMGGGFALEYAIEDQNSVKGLVLIAPETDELSEESLRDLEVPTLLIWGEKDEVFPVDDYARDLKNLLPRSKLILIKGARHAAYLDEPQEFHELMLDFLEEISS